MEAHNIYCNSFSSSVQFDSNKAHSLESFTSSASQAYQNTTHNFVTPQYNFDNQTIPHKEKPVIYTDIQNCINFSKVSNMQCSPLNGQKKKGCKPKIEFTLSRQENKVNRNSNKKYVNYKGIEVQPKQFVDYQCKCVKKCSSKLKPEDRESEFEKFWGLSAYDAQTAYIAAKVTEYPVKKRYSNNDLIKKDYTRTYSLCSTIVCREMFCKTLQISSGRINTALTKIRRKISINDQRGIKKTFGVNFKNTAQKKKILYENLSDSKVAKESINEIHISNCNSHNLSLLAYNINDTFAQTTLENDYGSSQQKNPNILIQKAEISIIEKDDSNVFSNLEMCSTICSKFTESSKNMTMKCDNTLCHKELTVPKRGRKLKYLQTREENKTNRNSNKPYINYKGVLIEPKMFVDFECKCSKKCHQNIDIVNKYSEFQKFWTLSYNAQTIYIVAAVTEQPVQKHFSQKNPSKKEFSRKYALSAINVCREMFCRTLQISPGRINTALKKYRMKSVLMDQRGLKQGGYNRLPTEKRNSVIRFFKRIPAYKSHYRKEKNRARYLPPDITLTKLYELYREEEKDNAVSNASFKKLFYSTFHYKSRETCYICDTFKKILKKDQSSWKLAKLKEEYEKHQAVAKKGKKYLDNDILLARKYPEIECLTLEIGKMLPLPRIPQNDMCYKRLLWLYNISVVSAKKQQSHFYLWPEGQAGKGAQEVGSCILKHIREQLVWSSAVSHIILWTYAYGGLIRNFKLILMLKCIIQSYPTLKSIKIKFLDSGHCSLPNHRDFNDVDKTIKQNNRFFLPEDYINVIKCCRKKKPPIVKNFNNDEFLSTEQLENHILKSDALKNMYNFNWSDVIEATLYSNQPFTIYYKTDFEGEFNNIDILHENGHHSSQNFIHLLVPLWPSGRALTPTKLKDLKSLLHLIPENAKNFYLSLQCGTGDHEDVDGLNEQLDFEIEMQNLCKQFL